MEQLTITSRFDRAIEARDTLIENFTGLWPMMNNLVSQDEQHILLRYSKNDSGDMEFMLTKMHAVLIGYVCYQYSEELTRDAAYLKFLQRFKSLEDEQIELIFTLYQRVPVEKILKSFWN